MNDFKSILKKASQLYEESSIPKDNLKNDYKERTEIITSTTAGLDFLTSYYGTTQKEMEDQLKKISNTKIRI